MKRQYNKPTVDIMEIEGNDVICGSCSSEGRRTFEDLSSNEKKGVKRLLDANKDGNLSFDEFNQGFGSGENCRITIDIYCKFTSNGPNLLAWS